MTERAACLLLMCGLSSKDAKMSDMKDNMLIVKHGGGLWKYRQIYKQATKLPLYFSFCL